MLVPRARLLIIDEVYMMHRQLMAQVEIRLRTVLGSDLHLGGWSVLLIGGPAPLPPVGHQAPLFNLLTLLLPTQKQRLEKEADPEQVRGVPSLKTVTQENAGLALFLPFLEHCRELTQLMLQRLLDEGNLFYKMLLRGMRRQQIRPD